jgi:hypothetical protein
MAKLGAVILITVFCDQLPASRVKLLTFTDDVSLIAPPVPN